MGLLHLLINDPFTFILLAIPLLYSIIIHELAHGWVAYRMGDPTAKSLGRLSLNPLKHLDPVVPSCFLFLVLAGPSRPSQFQLPAQQTDGAYIRFLGGHPRQYVFGFCGFFPVSPLSPPPASVLMTFLYYLRKSISSCRVQLNTNPAP